MTEPAPTATILCVEDERDLLEELVEELAGAGHRVLSAVNADEAEALLSRERPDIVLCDVMMPGRNGFDLLQDLRRAGVLAPGTAFIFLTALSDREPRLTGLKTGADDYLAKPVDLDLLHLTIRNRLLFLRRVQTVAMPGRGRVDVHLSRREREVLAAVGRGQRTAVIAHELGISENTVSQYLKEVYRKLGINNRADAARAAVAMGLSR